MKGRFCYSAVTGFSEKGLPLMFPMNAVFSFDPKMVEVGYNGNKYNALVNYRGNNFHVPVETLVATETESVEDVFFTMELQKEFAAHKEIVIVEEVKNSVRQGYYLYPDESVPVGKGPHRRVFFELVKALAIDADIDAYLLSKKKNGTFDLFFIKGEGNFVKVHEFGSVVSMMIYFAKKGS